MIDWLIDWLIFVSWLVCSFIHLITCLFYKLYQQNKQVLHSYLKIVKERETLRSNFQSWTYNNINIYIYIDCLRWCDWLLDQGDKFDSSSSWGNPTRKHRTFYGERKSHHWGLPRDDDEPNPPTGSNSQSHHRKQSTNRTITETTIRDTWPTTIKHPTLHLTLTFDEDSKNRVESSRERMTEIRRTSVFIHSFIHPSIHPSIHSQVLVLCSVSRESWHMSLY